jgi:hypothetical protein
MNRSEVLDWIFNTWLRVDALFVQTAGVAVSYVEHYEIRCEIAHGRLLSAPQIHLPAIVQEYPRLLGQLA